MTHPVPKNKSANHPGTNINCIQPEWLKSWSLLATTAKYGAKTGNTIKKVAASMVSAVAPIAPNKIPATKE